MMSQAIVHNVSRPHNASANAPKRPNNPVAASASPSRYPILPVLRVEHPLVLHARPSDMQQLPCRRNQRHLLRLALRDHPSVAALDDRVAPYRRNRRHVERVTQPGVACVPNAALRVEARSILVLARHESGEGGLGCSVSSTTR
jgi:hypothetical protein